VEEYFEPPQHHPFPSSRPCAHAVKLLWFPAQRQFSKYEDIAVRKKQEEEGEEDDTL
jgi:hypothetical protein